MYNNSYLTQKYSTAFEVLSTRLLGATPAKNHQKKFIIAAPPTNIIICHAKSTVKINLIAYLFVISQAIGFVMECL